MGTSESLEIHICNVYSTGTHQIIKPLSNTMVRAGHMGPQKSSGSLHRLGARQPGSDCPPRLSVHQTDYHEPRVWEPHCMFQSPAGLLCSEASNKGQSYWQYIIAHTEIFWKSCYWQSFVWTWNLQIVMNKQFPIKIMMLSKFPDAIAGFLCLTTMVCHWLPKTAILKERWVIFAVFPKVNWK